MVCGGVWRGVNACDVCVCVCVYVCVCVCVYTFMSWLVCFECSFMFFVSFCIRVHLRVCVHVCVSGG